jgi:hypothetical protein
LNLRGVYDLHYPLKYLADLHKTGQMGVYRHPTLAWRGISHAHEHAREYARLPDLYPGAKFALTTRTAESWAASFMYLIERLKCSRAFTSDSTLYWRMALIVGDLSQPLDQARLVDVFYAHDQAVRSFFGAELLTLDLAEADTTRAVKLNQWLGVDGVTNYPHQHDRDGVPSAAAMAANQAAKELLLSKLAQRGYTSIEHEVTR